MADEKKPLENPQEETKSIKKLNEQTRVVDGGTPELQSPDESAGEDLSSNGICGGGCSASA